MAVLLDSFKYSVAGKSYRGHLVKGLRSSDPYFQGKTDPEEPVLLLSDGGSVYYPVSIYKLNKHNIDEMGSDEIFVSGEYSQVFLSAKFTGTRKRCDICSMQTNKVHKINYDSSRTNIRRQVKNREGTIDITTDKDAYELDSFYHCHFCMKDIYEELENYLDNRGKSVLVSDKI